MEQALLKAWPKMRGCRNLPPGAGTDAKPNIVYAMNEKQRACMSVLIAKVKDTDRTNIVVPGFRGRHGMAKATSCGCSGPRTWTAARAWQDIQ